MKNPIDYRLKKVVDRHEVGLHMAALRKRVKLIFHSFMKRMRAAYAFRVKEINASLALREDTKQHELGMWASECSDAEEEINTLFNQMTDLLTPTNWKSYDRIRGDFETRDLDQIANEKIDYSNDAIRHGNGLVKRVEQRGFRTPRNNQAEPSGFTEREHQLYQTRIHQKNLRALMLALKANYPYIREKYRARLAKLIFSVLPDRRKLYDATEFPMDYLIKIGIPAADVVGPWWPHLKNVKSPMDFVNWIETSYGDLKVDGDVVVRYRDWSSPDAPSWLYAHGLDGSDGSLQGAIRHYYQHHKAAPSVEWARRRSNELEAERKQQEMSRKIKPVTEFLKASERALKHAIIGVPPLLNEWRIVKPADAKELCERAQRDGLCVVDVISGLATDSDDEDDWLDRCNREGVCTLLFSTDPKCRTIVGLDGEGKCTSEHHCTGRNNEVDEEAWEYFK